jgi:hypothetical protein
MDPRTLLAQREPLDEASFECLVENEEANPGATRVAATDLLTRPDRPLEPVDVGTVCERIDKIANERWSIDRDTIARPTDLPSLVALLEHARTKQTSLRFVGAARSLSRAPQPAKDGTLVATCEYGRELALEVDTLRADVDPKTLYRAEAGRVFADVLIDLAQSNRALADMGSGDFQSLVGALSTSTHGSGIRYPAVPGLVRSLDVVTFDAHGAIIKQRIEPTAGITDPRKFAAEHHDDGLVLVQDDDLFASWTVSLGCLGPIYSLVIDVVPTYWLHETRTSQWWSDVKQSLDHDLATVDYYEILISSWPETNAGKPDHRCLVTRRELVTDPTLQHVAGGRPLAMALVQTELGRIAAAVDLAVSLRDPFDRVAKMLHTGVSATAVAGYTDKWFEVLLLRMDVNADSAEIGIPLRRTTPDHVDPSNAIAAADCILTHALANQSRMRALLGDHKYPFLSAFEQLCQGWREAALHTSPISLRFVREERALMSMQVDTPSCMIEMPMPGVDAYDRRMREKHPLTTKELRLYEAYVAGRTKLFETIEADLLARFGARPHWGQANFMDWSKVERVYPGAARWRSVYEVANREGVFDNPLTDQLGISKRGK